MQLFFVCGCDTVCCLLLCYIDTVMKIFFPLDRPRGNKNMLGTLAANPHAGSSGCITNKCTNDQKSLS